MTEATSETTRLTQTCTIRWINAAGHPTDDTNPSVCRVRTIDRHEWIAGRQIHFTASEWFPCCAEHAKQLHAPGMHIWECQPLD